MSNEKDIDLTLFNLVYMRKSDNRLFLVRLIAKPYYVIIDTQTGIVDRDMTEAKLKRWYAPVKHLNRLNKKRPWPMIYGKKK